MLIYTVSRSNLNLKKQTYMVYPEATVCPETCIRRKQRHVGIHILELQRLARFARRVLNAHIQELRPIPHRPIRPVEWRAHVPLDSPQAAARVPVVDMDPSRNIDIPSLLPRGRSRHAEKTDSSSLHIVSSRFLSCASLLWRLQHRSLCAGAVQH